MNLKRLTRMDWNCREMTLRDFLKSQRINQLKQWGSEYGLRDTRNMRKEELVDALCVGIQNGVDVLLESE